MTCANNNVVVSARSTVGSTPLMLKGVADLPALARLYLHLSGPDGPTDYAHSTVYLDRLTVDGRYVLGTPPRAGLLGGAEPKVMLKALNDWMEHFGPTVPVALRPGELLEAETTTTDDGGTVVLTAERVSPPLTLVPEVAEWLGYTVELPGTPSDYRIEVPGTSKGGRLSGIAFTVYGNTLMSLCQVGFSTPQREIVPPAPLVQWWAWMREGRLPAEIATEPGEPLYLIVTDPEAGGFYLSFAGEWVRPFTALSGGKP